MLSAMDLDHTVRSDAKRRAKPFTFRPPKPSRIVARLIKNIVPGELRRKLKVHEVDISEGDMELLRSMKGKRVLLMPSHSGGFEPYVIIRLSDMLNDDYYFLAAVEVFETSAVFGWIMQKLGAYSIIRGAADRASFQMTRKILMEGKRWLVIFPEGQTVWQNDTVIPFQQGVTQLAFKAYERLAKEDAENSLYCLPMSIKYVFTKNVDDEMRESMKRLESQLLAGDYFPPDDPFERLRNISDAILSANEKRHNIKPAENADLNTRIQAMKEVMISRIERQLDVEPKSEQELLDRIRTLFNALDRITMDDPDASNYGRKLLDEQKRLAGDLYDDLWRVLQFIAIYADYVRENMTVERFMDVLCILENEVFGERRIAGPRKACVKVGAPIDLKDRFEEYKADKRGATEKVTLDLESSVRTMLEELNAHSIGKVVS